MIEPELAGYIGAAAAYIALTITVIIFIRSGKK